MTNRMLIGNLPIDKIMIGSLEVAKVMLGNVEIWSLGGDSTSEQDTTLLYPNSDSTATLEFANYSDELTHWEGVKQDLIVPDGNFVNISGFKSMGIPLHLIDEYGLDNIDNVSNISKLKISVSFYYILFCGANPDISFSVFIKINDNIYYGDTFNTTTVTTDYFIGPNEVEEEWVLNPDTTSAWTSDDINIMEVGIECWSGDGINGYVYGFDAAELYVEVTHDKQFILSPEEDVGTTEFNNGTEQPTNSLGAAQVFVSNVGQPGGGANISAANIMATWDMTDIYEVKDIINIDAIAITSVTVEFDFDYTSGGETVESISMGLGGYIQIETATDVWTDYLIGNHSNYDDLQIIWVHGYIISKTWTTNPYTSSAWTIDDLDNLRVKFHSTGNPQGAYCFGIYDFGGVNITINYR